MSRDKHDTHVLKVAGYSPNSVFHITSYLTSGKCTPNMKATLCWLFRTLQSGLRDERNNQEYTACVSGLYICGTVRE